MTHAMRLRFQSLNK
ncbi:erythromycin resistance leader peptide [Cytobacillus massiliigabonensis]